MQDSDSIAFLLLASTDSSEYIDDSMYTAGWTEVSTCSACDSRDCLCAGSGSCVHPLFNHYMYKECNDDTEQSAGQLDFPLYLGNDAQEEICVEEVRCRERTVGAAYAYYVREVLYRDLSQTMISLFCGEYKSTCFDMSCFVLEMAQEAVHNTDLCLDDKTGGPACVLARGYEASQSLLRAMCALGIDPIVTDIGDYSLTVVDNDGEIQSVNVCTSGFVWSSGCGFNMSGLSESGTEYAVTGTHAHTVRAVRTASATVSVVLKPKSMYGGKNPSTKLVSYFVHNVKIQ